MTFLGALGAYQPEVHPTAWIAPGAVVVGKVTLGRDSSVWYGSVLRADEEEVIVGDECNIQDLSCIHADPGLPTILEDGVTLGHKAMVHGAHVEAGSLIGSGAIVLNGARIGARTLVAAGALVTPGKRFPSGVLVAGAPATVKRELNENDLASLELTAAAYVQKAKQHSQAEWK